MHKWLVLVPMVDIRNHGITPRLAPFVKLDADSRVVGQEQRDYGRTAWFFIGGGARSESLMPCAEVVDSETHVTAP